MTIDISRFHGVFFEESLEGLSAMEAGLLALDQGNAEPETVNTVFRAAHSIKGGAGTFGFTAIAALTHHLETLLDQMRSGRRATTRAETDALLRSVDVLRQLLGAAQNGTPVDGAAVAAIERDLTALLNGNAPAAPAAPAAPVQPQAAAAVGANKAGWRIRFVPQPHLLRTGNEPLRIFRELAGLGRLTACADLSRLPPFDELDPTCVHLGWTLELEGDVERAAVADLFTWVEGDCELAIEPLSAPAQAAAPAASAGTTSMPVAVAAVAAGGAPAEAAPAASAENPATSSIRVSVDRVDALINLVGELVITQAMLAQYAGRLDPAENEKLLTSLSQLDRNTRDLQEAVMAVRMLPVGTVFSRFPRVVRDLAGKLDKQVRLKTVGEATELDKGVIERISDPLNHLVRNSLDHGLEPAADRAAAGKDETGTITLSASHQGGHIVIEVADDGRGLDRARILASAAKRGIPVSDAMTDAEVWQLIFAPGLSTAEKVTDVSGRGVGMDVVKKNIQALGGQVEVRSERSRGSAVVIRLPLTLAILDGMSVAVAGEVFVIPLNCVVESLQPKRDDVKAVSGAGRLLRVRNEYIQLTSLHELFGLRVKVPEPHEAIVVIVEAEGRRLAVLVDELVGQQQVVIKNLENNYRRIRGISGATIMGDGRVALIVDVGSLTRASARAA